MDPKINSYYYKWLLYAPLGLVLVGFGLCFFNETGQLKHQGAGFSEWFGWGTVSLIIINAGLAFFGDAVKNRVLYEIKREKKS